MLRRAACLHGVLKAINGATEEVPATEQLFVFVGAYVRTGRREDGGGSADTNDPRAYSSDVPNNTEG